MLLAESLAMPPMQRKSAASRPGISADHLIYDVAFRAIKTGQPG